MFFHLSFFFFFFSGHTHGMQVFLGWGLSPSPAVATPDPKALGNSIQRHNEWNLLSLKLRGGNVLGGALGKDGQRIECCFS